MNSPIKCPLSITQGLTEEKLYSSHRKIGGVVLSKGQMLTLMHRRSSIKRRTGSNTSSIFSTQNIGNDSSVVKRLDFDKENNQQKGIRKNKKDGKESVFTRLAKSGTVSSNNKRVKKKFTLMATANNKEIAPKYRILHKRISEEVLEIKEINSEPSKACILRENTNIANQQTVSSCINKPVYFKRYCDGKAFKFDCFKDEEIGIGKSHSIMINDMKIDNDCETDDETILVTAKKFYQDIIAEIY